ncbi:hypothetical protein E6O75_ATG02115 [Venturia nashicola]|uniref:Uncharacterized protein n=1 Tax=Venturia nashicola TaxID=86259 RepID=A0A4Z1PD48_9PEZI|nr:hypothetical protein E6O75_ATG02115 [Venturia nashicola]
MIFCTQSSISVSVLDSTYLVSSSGLFTVWLFKLSFAGTCSSRESCPLCLPIIILILMSMSESSAVLVATIVNRSGKCEEGVKEGIQWVAGILLGLVRVVIQAGYEAMSFLYYVVYWVLLRSGNKELY